MGEYSLQESFVIESSPVHLGSNPVLPVPYNENHPIITEDFGNHPCETVESRIGFHICPSRLALNKTRTLYRKELCSPVQGDLALEKLVRDSYCAPLPGGPVQSEVDKPGISYLYRDLR